MAHTKTSKGDIVQVTFLDHCEDGDDDALKFIVWGRVVRVTRKCLRIVSWAHANEEDAADSEPGTEKTFTIVRSAITDLSIMY